MRGGSRRTSRSRVTVLTAVAEAEEHRPAGDHDQRGRPGISVAGLRLLAERRAMTHRRSAAPV